ncbi:MAG: ribosome small subunit-dependent GTPase A [Pseudodesulfovibrio sp.]|jgi:ribosome biogenesis GTPase|uniref:ribosome small subunit-dependent GTPase A n=1 Tax=Pseudodesulfovibrio sp. TaxID=2035812 RepID=UPI003D12857A
MTERIEIPAQASFDPTSLRPLGWNDHFDRELAAMNPGPGRVARVISVQRGLFLVSDGGREWLCSPAGRLLHGATGDYPVTGDWVLADDVVANAIIPRKNLLSRGEAGARGTQAKTAHRAQPIAANLDTVFIVCGLDRDFNLRRLERYMTLVHNCGLSPVVVLTKADLHRDPEEFRLEAESIAFGVPVALTSLPDGAGVNELGRYLAPGRTVAMLGSSGAGKSTLANMLHGSDIRATSEVSKSVGKGRHTTTTRELIRMPQGGMLMDNPGIREIAFHEDGQGADSAFADILELSAECRFADCSHDLEPGCAVRRAVEAGELDPARLESYHKMKRELRYLSDRRTKGASRAEKERWQGLALMRKDLNRRR